MEKNKFNMKDIQEDTKRHILDLMSDAYSICLFTKFKSQFCFITLKKDKGGRGKHHSGA